MNEDLEEYFDYEMILNRMLEKIPNTIDKREGSIIYDALAPAAAEIAQMYLVLENNIGLVFADTAVEEYLDRLANQIGLQREHATKAIKQGVFYDNEDDLMDVGIGQRFSIDNLVYKAIEKIELGKFKMECETAGTIGNTSAGDMIPVDYIEGLAKAELGEVLILGEDEETDEALRKRYYDKTGEEAFGGNVMDYKNKTKRLNGVGAVKVTPVWNGGGTVKLTILDSEFNKASNGLIQDVQNQICPNFSKDGTGIAPIGHSVTVNTVEEVLILIQSELTVDENIEIATIKAEIVKSINAYFLNLKKMWEETGSLIIRKAQIETILLNTMGVVDVANTMMNGQMTNILLEGNQIPKLEEVVIV